MNIKTQVDGIKLGTDILDVQVPDRLRTKQSLGIDWVNDAVGGDGMTPSTVMMVTGAPGCGKSTLLRQLADSITDAGHVVLYNTGEESIYQVKMRIEEMGLKRGFKVGQETYTGKVLAWAREQQEREPKRQVFILQDSLQTLNDGHYKDGGVTGQTPVRCCEQLTDWAKETYGIVIFIGQVTKAGVFAGKNTIRHMIDSHVEILHDQEPKSSTCGRLLFSVSKNRFGYTGKTYVVGLGKQGLYATDDVSEVTTDDDEVNTASSGTMAKVTSIRPGRAQNEG